MTGEQPLTAIAEQIRSAHAKAITSAQTAIEHAIDAGRLLSHAKEQLEHGHWLPWLKANCADISVRTAQSYMKLAQNVPMLLEANTQRTAHFTIAETLRIAEHRAIKPHVATERGERDISRLVVAYKACRQKPPHEPACLIRWEML